MVLGVPILKHFRVKLGLKLVTMSTSSANGTELSPSHNKSISPAFCACVVVDSFLKVLFFSFKSRPKLRREAKMKMGELLPLHMYLIHRVLLIYIQTDILNLKQHVCTTIR